MFCGQHACNTVFRYNISQNDLAGVLNLASSPNGEIYNNVFYIKEGVKVNRTGMSGGWGNTISNNIFYYSGSEPADATLGNWGDITAQWQGNLYYNYANIPDDPYAVTADPMFVDPGKGPTGAQLSGLVHDRSAFEGYQLQPGSPAINAGVPVENNGGLDFFGNKVDLLPDIGVHDAGTFQSDAERAVLVDVELGGTATITDTVHDFTGLTPVVDDGKIASVTITDSSEVARTYGESVTALENGAYILINNRAGKTLINADAASQQGEAATMSGLSLEGTKESIQDNAIWTLTAADGGFYVQDAEGKYLSIVQNDANLISDESVVEVIYRNGTWTLNQGGAYLNDAANKGVCASGWNGDGIYDASTDSGSLWTIYPVTEKTFYTTELTFSGLYPGTTNIIIGDTLYLVRVSGELREVELEVGETATFADASGNYTNADTSSLDETVATVELTGMLTDEYALGSKVTALTSGSKYILVNTRAAKPVTNGPATNNAASGLHFTGEAADAAKNAIWTITAADGGYYVQDLDGQYMTVGSDFAGLTADPAVLTLNYSGSTWTISQNGAYLNHHGGSGSTCAAGWQDDSAAGDAGSQWDIYQVSAVPGENGTQITFTAVGGGETDVQIGDVVYHIVVTGDAHGFVNGFCDHCSEYEPAVLANGVYEIGNAGQLYWFAQLVDGGELDANAVLTADITVNAEGEERKWNAIGSNAKKYSGTFDGQGFTVSGLFYDNDKTTGGYVGLIASLDEGGLVKNVTVADSYLCGYRFLGAIVGQNVGGTIENCRNENTTVTGSGSNIGGIVGGNSGTVTGCSSSGEISSDAGNNLGGIAGTNAGIIELSYNEGDITSSCCSDEHCVGGIAGENLGGTIRNCYNTGAISNKGTASGGIVGKADQGTIEACHNVGEVSGKADVGGIVGKAYNNPAVENCHNLSDESAAQFASGEITYLLNGSTSEGELVWKQTIGSDDYPKFQGGTVYYDSATGTYSNNGIAHQHTPGEAVRENKVDATCTEAGSYDSVVYCSDCGEEISRVTVTVEALGHDWQEDGSCSHCGEVKDEPVKNPFEDVSEDEFYYDAILWAVGEGITNGVTTTRFAPDDLTTRGQIVTFLWRAAGEPEPTNKDNPFTDVKAGDFCYKAVLWAVENGITNGVTKTTFAPNSNCTRAQAVTFLHRYLGQPESSIENPFTDVDSGEFYANAICWAVENGVTTGVTPTTFEPDSTCTRGQIVAFLYRALA